MGYQFATTCFGSTYELVTALTESEKQISGRTFRRLLGGSEVDRWASGMGYDVHWERGGVRLRNDRHVSYYRGVYDGARAVFIRHSAIEHIWVEV